MKRAKKLEKNIDKHVFDGVQKLQQGIENDSIFRDYLINLGCIFVRTFGYFLASVLVATYSGNNTILCHR